MFEATNKRKSTINREGSRLQVGFHDTENELMTPRSCSDRLIVLPPSKIQAFLENREVLFLCAIISPKKDMRIYAHTILFRRTHH